MKNILKFALGMAGAVSLAPLAHATVLLQHTADTIDASAPTQMGRIPNIVELDHNPQSWDPKKDGSLGETTYPGVIDTTTAFHYNAYTFTAAQLGNGQFVEINFYVPNTGTDLFVSAWTSYNGTSSVQSGTGWIGDSSRRRNFFLLTDARYFDVTVPKGANLIVVVNSQNDATAIGESYKIQINAYANKEYSDITLSSSIPLSGGMGSVDEVALLGGAVMTQRHRRELTS